MPSHTLKIDVELTLEDLRRIRSWFRTYAAEEGELVTQGDRSLDARLRAERNDIIDKAEAEAHAARASASTKQYVGPERRLKRSSRLRIVRSRTHPSETYRDRRKSNNIATH